MASTFKVIRKSPELVRPAGPTPYQIKSLSGFDSLDLLRFHVPGINIYRKCGSMEGKDPVGITREAIAKALVFYYPFAGRLREYGGRNLAVECTGEGVVFVEADADVTLEQFEGLLLPPFPNLEELLLEPVSTEVINVPLMIFQVTRLKCGGFILAYRFPHPMSDGAGISQFMTAVGELARGAAVPSVPPVWQRHLLTRKHDTAIRPVPAVTPTPLDKMHLVQRNFFFDAGDISALRRSLPPHLQNCSKFEVVAACAWRCWTIAVSPKPDEEIAFMATVDIRKRMKPPLPVGYYGNGIAPAMAVTNIDLVDLGWGTAAYGGVAKGVADWASLPVSWYIPFEDKTGQQGVIVPTSLPLHAMEVFATQLHSMMTAARKIS